MLQQLGLISIIVPLLMGFFSFISQKLQELKDLLQQRIAAEGTTERELAQLDTKIMQIIGDVSFSDLLTGELSTIANINFEEIIDLLTANLIK